MSVSEVSICNAALALLATSPITVLGDSSRRESILCESLYPLALNEMLESADWSFAIKRLQLAATSDTDVIGWNYKVMLPGNHIRTLGVWTNIECSYREKYEQGEDHIYVNTVPVYLKYIGTVDDPNKLSPLFIRALYTDIASKLCIPLSEDVKREVALSQKVEFYLDEAAALNGLQGSQERIKSNAFIEVR